MFYKNVQNSLKKLIEAEVKKFSKFFKENPTVRCNYPLIYIHSHKRFNT